jgi:Tfp pilus assembly PilM family ATPase
LDLVSETKNILRFYEEHVNPSGKISRILLSGGTSKLKHLPSVFKELLVREQDEAHAVRSLSGLRVELGNPWLKILGKKQVPPLSREDSLSYSTAIGLALRDFED